MWKLLSIPKRLYSYRYILPTVGIYNQKCLGTVIHISTLWRCFSFGVVWHEGLHDALCMQVGRTARQGQVGQVTSLYSPDRKPLAEAVKAAVEADMPVEGAFSRNRSFSKKFKKYGQYVPRGQGLSV